MKNLKSLFVFLAFLLALCVIYSPVLIFHYVYHDELSILSIFKDDAFKYSLSERMLVLGRYTNAIFIIIEQWIVHKVADLNILRFLSLACISGIALILFKQLCKFGLKEIHAFLAILAMCCLPGFHHFIYLAVGSLMTLAAFFSCLAFILLKDNKSILWSVLLMLLALSTHQSWAMFYWVLVGMELLFSEGSSWTVLKKRLTLLMGTGLFSITLYAIIIHSVKLISTHTTHFISMESLGLYDMYAPSKAWQIKLQWFLKEPLPHALNLWTVYGQVRYLVHIPLGFFLLLTLILAVTRSHLTPTLIRFGLVIALLFLSFLPNLITQSNTAFYRCIMPLSCFIWMLCIWSFQQWTRFLKAPFSKWVMTGFLSLAVLLGGNKAFSNVLYFRVLPSHVEWNAYTSMAEQIASNPQKNIYINSPGHIPSIEFFDEFGVLTTHYASDVFSMCYCAFNEIGIHPQELEIALSFPDDPRIYKFNEFKYWTMPDGQRVFKRIGKEKRLPLSADVEPGYVKGSIFMADPVDPSSIKTGYYHVDLKDIFKRKHYKELIAH